MPWTAADGFPAQARPARRGLLALACAIPAAAFLCALDVASRLAQTSDSAQGFVAGHAIVRGNVLLSGWHFPFNDYYFTDTLAYAGLEWLAGPRPFLLALEPALIYAAFVCAALLLCVRRAAPITHNIEAGAAVALLLAVPAWIGGWNPLLMSDMHFASVLFALVSIALCAELASGQHNVWSFVGLCLPLTLVTAATLASDPFSLVFAFGPALTLLAADVTLLGPRASGPNCACSSGALFSLAGGIMLGLCLPPLIASAGGFTTESDVVTGFASVAHFARNLVALIAGVLTLFGTNPFVADFGFPGAFFFVLRAIALTLAAGTTFWVVRRLFARDCVLLLDRMLCTGLLTSLAACAVSMQFAKGITEQNFLTGGPPMRYAMPAVLFAAVLAGRQMPQMLAAFLFRVNAGEESLRVIARGALVFLASLAMLAEEPAIDLHPRWIADNPPATAARWLVAHGLRNGAGEYWSANLVTAMSGDAVAIHSVVPDEGKLAHYVWSSDADMHTLQFIIWQDENKTGLTFAQVRASYPVCRTALVAGYRVALLPTAEQCTTAARHK